MLKILVVYVGPSRRMSGKDFEIKRTSFQILIHGNLCATRRDTTLARKMSCIKKMHKFIQSKSWDSLDVSTRTKTDRFGSLQNWSNTS